MSWDCCGAGWSLKYTKFHVGIGTRNSWSYTLVVLGVRSSCHLIRDVKFHVLRMVVWSEIVGRMSWHSARLVDKLYRAKVNKEVGRFIVRNSDFVVRHRQMAQRRFTS